MDSRMLLGVGLVLLVAAGGAGWFGYQTTVDARQQMAAAEAKVAEVKAQAAAEAASRSPVLIAARDLKAFEVLSATDLIDDHLQRPVPGAYTSAEQLIGRFPQTDIPAGSMLQTDQFQPGGMVSRLLQQGERAMAIAVDEVIGGGGFVQPGDTVDVLMYVPGDSRPASSAQIVMRALRVLGYGDALVTPEALSVDGKQTAPESPQAESTSAARPARTAILAVKEPDMTRLMLASSVGVLRLAIRPADEAVQPGVLTPGRTTPKDNRMERAGTLTPASMPAVAAAPRAQSFAPARPGKVAPSPRPDSNIVIFRGLNRVDAP